MLPERISGLKINPSEGAELTPLERARQKIVDYYKIVELESPQFQRFSDEIEFQIGSAEQMKTDDHSQLSKARLNIRRNTRKDKEYGKESEKLPSLLEDYWNALSPELTNGWVKIHDVGHRFKYAHGLMEIRDQIQAENS